MMPCTKSCSTSSCRHSSFRIRKARTKETTAIDCRCTKLYFTVPKWIRSLSFSWPSPRRPTRSITGDDLWRTVDLHKHRHGLNKEAMQHLLNQSPAFGRVLEQRHHFDSVTVHCPKRRRLRAVVAIQSYPSLETQNQRRQRERIRIAKPLV